MPHTCRWNTGVWTNMPQNAARAFHDTKLFALWTFHIATLKRVSRCFNVPFTLLISDRRIILVILEACAVIN